MVVEMKCELTGIVTKFNYQDNKGLGLQSATFEYPPSVLKEWKSSQKEQLTPKEEKVYINPANGKEISYKRAKALKLVK